MGHTASERSLQMYSAMVVFLLILPPRKQNRAPPEHVQLQLHPSLQRGPPPKAADTVDRRYQNLAHDPLLVDTGTWPQHTMTAGGPANCGTGPRPPADVRQVWDRSLPPPPTWAKPEKAGTGKDPSAQPLKDSAPTLSEDDSSEYYWSGTHKYHVLEKDE